MSQIERSVVLKQADPNNNVFDTTFKRVNPNTSDTVLKTAFLNLSGLTNNTFISLSVVDSRDITDTNIEGSN